MCAACVKTEVLACCGDFGKGDPNGFVWGAGEVEGVAVVGISRKWRCGRARLFGHTAPSTG